jgi:hypothetical protein
MRFALFFFLFDAFDFLGGSELWCLAMAMAMVEVGT